MLSTLPPTVRDESVGCFGSSEVGPTKMPSNGSAIREKTRGAGADHPRPGDDTTMAGSGRVKAQERLDGKLERRPQSSQKSTAVGEGHAIPGSVGYVLLFQRSSREDRVMGEPGGPGGRRTSLKRPPTRKRHGERINNSKILNGYDSNLTNEPPNDVLFRPPFNSQSRSPHLHLPCGRRTSARGSFFFSDGHT